MLQTDVTDAGQGAEWAIKGQHNKEQTLYKADSGSVREEGDEAPAVLTTAVGGGGVPLWLRC